MPSAEVLLADPAFGQLSPAEQTRVRARLAETVQRHPAFRRLPASEQAQVLTRIETPTLWQRVRGAIYPALRAGEAGGEELVAGLKTLSPFGRRTEGPVEAILRNLSGATQIIGAPFRAAGALTEAPAVGVPGLEQPRAGGLSVRDILRTIGEGTAIGVSGFAPRPLGVRERLRYEAAKGPRVMPRLLQPAAWQLLEELRAPLEPTRTFRGRAPGARPAAREPVFVRSSERPERVIGPYPFMRRPLVVRGEPERAALLEPPGPSEPILLVDPQGRSLALTHEPPRMLQTALERLGYRPVASRGTIALPGEPLPTPLPTAQQLALRRAGEPLPTVPPVTTALAPVGLILPPAPRVQPVAPPAPAAPAAPRTGAPRPAAGSDAARLGNAIAAAAEAAGSEAFAVRRLLRNPGAYGLRPGPRFVRTNVSVSGGRVVRGYAVTWADLRGIGLTHEDALRDLARRIHVDVGEEVELGLRRRETPSEPLGTPPLPRPAPEPIVAGPRKPPTRRPVDPTTVNLEDPRSVAQYIMATGRLKSSPSLAGEFREIPWYVKSKTGRPVDEVVEELAQAKGVPYKEAEDKVLIALRGGRLSRRLEPTVSEIERPRPLADLLVHPEEWTLMSRAQRNDAIRFFRFGREGEAAPPTPALLEVPPSPLAREAIDAATRELAQKDFAAKQFRPPVINEATYRAEWKRLTAVEKPTEPPRAERTPAGEQSVIPGTPGRAMPPTALRGERPQRPLAETPLFGREAEFQAAQTEIPKPAGPAWQEVRSANLATYISQPRGFRVEQISPDEWVVSDLRARHQGQATVPTFDAARQWVTKRLGLVRGFVPPVPVSGPPEEERETTRGRLQQLAQALALGLPLLSVVGGGRFRGWPRPLARPPAGPRPVVPPSAVSLPPRPPAPPTTLPGALPPVPAAPLRQYYVLPADIPQALLPAPTRAARFFLGGKTRMQDVPLLSTLFRWLPPEEVVRGDPAATAIVRGTYRRHDDGLLLARALEDKARAVYRGLSRGEIERINRVLDTPGADDAAIQAALPPPLAEVGIRARREIFDAGADATGLPRERRITGYFPRFRSTLGVEVTERKIIEVGEQQRYIPRTFIDAVPKRYEAFFLKERTAQDVPATHLGLDGVLIYQRAATRHLTMHGGFHPVTGQPIPGYLDEVGPLLNQVTPALRPYVAEFVNYFLGTPASRPGSPVAQQLSRILRNIEFSRLIGLNFLSPVVNTTQQTNTLAWISPQAFARGYADLLNPARRAVAQEFLHLPPLGKLDLESIGRGVPALDRIEELSSRLSHVSGVLFSLSETQGNRYAAFLGGWREAEALGLRGRAALEFARDIVDLGQFPVGGPAMLPAMRHPGGAVLGQFKQFQIRQALHFKNMVVADLQEWQAALARRRVPVEVRGRRYELPDGTVLTRRPRLFPRVAKWLLLIGAVGGPDAVFPGLTEELEKLGVRYPGLLPAIGVGIAEQLGLGAVRPQEVARSLLFFLPGPLIGHTQDALSALTGLNWGHGLTEMLRGGLFRPLSLDQRVDRAVKGFTPVAGITLARARRAAKQRLTPGEERAATTVLEALGLAPATGRLLLETAPGEPLRTLTGHPSPRVREQWEGRERRRQEQEQRRGERLRAG